VERRDLHNPPAPVCTPKDFDGNIIFGKFVDAEERTGKRLSELAGWPGWSGWLAWLAWLVKMVRVLKLSLQ